MSLIIVASHTELVAAINNFNAGYHRDYSCVRKLSASYLKTPLSSTAAQLAQELSNVLYRWGAGKRKAPLVQPIKVIEKALLDPDFHKLLSWFASITPAMLSLTGTGHSLKRTISTSTCAILDANLLSVLSQISAKFLIGNTNVTYPMKAMMLLTGFMPALDSQVRKGLGLASFKNTNVTQFLMPSLSKSSEALKLTRLPFYLADCYTRHTLLINTAIAASMYPLLVTEPSRVFDILLFMQGSTGAALLKLNTSASRWYDIP